MKRSKPAPIETFEPTGLLIGYARVSTPDQDPQMQVDLLLKAGCLPEHIHVETASGVKANRPELERALKDARRGDTFVVYKLDRLGRSLLDLITKLNDLSQRGIAFRSLTEGIDTTTPVGRFAAMMIGALAQFERDLISERTRDGIAGVKARGGYHGGKPTFDREKAKALFRKGHDAREVAKFVGVTRSRLYQLFTAEERERLAREGKRKPKKRK